MGSYSTMTNSLSPPLGCSDTGSSLRTSFKHFGSRISLTGILNLIDHYYTIGLWLAYIFKEQFLYRQFYFLFQCGLNLQTEYRLKTITVTEPAEGHFSLVIA